MKKILFGAIALAGFFAVSCTKEADTPDSIPAKNQVEMTFQASLDDATRTAYANEKTFSWVAGDNIRVRLYNPETSEYSWATFTTEESGATVQFKGVVDEGLEFADLAYYQFDESTLEYTNDYEGVPYGWLHYYLDFTQLESPLSVVPLVGHLSEGSGNLAFKTAVGILKISLENIPDYVDYVVVYANEEAGNTLNGLYALTQDPYISHESALAGKSWSDLMVIPAVEEGSAVIYVPVPVGTLSAGLAVQFYSANEELLGSKETVKDILVERNKIIAFPAIDVSEIAEEPAVVEPVSVPVLWDFEDGAENWTIIDADGDGNNWQLASGLASYSGSVCMISASYDNESQAALTPDNWAFTPPIQLTQGNYLSFWIRAQDLDWAAEHYAVYIAKGSPSTDADVLIAENEFPEGEYFELGPDGHYQHYVLQIPAEYDNEIVCIGFRHFNCTDNFLLNIDDVAILEEEPEPLPEVAYEDYLGEWAAGADLFFTVAPKVAGESYTITGLADQGNYSVEAVFQNNCLVLYEQQVGGKGSNQIVLQGITSAYKFYLFDATAASQSAILSAYYNANEGALKISSSFAYYCFLIYEDSSYSSNTSLVAIPSSLTPYVADTTTYLYEEDFEEDISQTWTLIDADGDGNNWTQKSGVKSYSGTSVLVSESYDNNSGPLTPDNWAFTPAVTLTSNNYLSFWVGPQDPSFGAEHYAVYITDTQPTADNLDKCAVLLAEQVYPEGTPAEVSSDEIFQRFILPIPSSYNGKPVYIGFRHFNSTDQYWLNLDDVKISEGAPVVASAPAHHAPAKGFQASQAPDIRIRKSVVSPRMRQLPAVTLARRAQ